MGKESPVTRAAPPPVTDTHLLPPQALRTLQVREKNLQYNSRLHFLLAGRPAELWFDPRFACAAPAVPQGIGLEEEVRGKKKWYALPAKDIDDNAVPGSQERRIDGRDS